MKEKKVSIFTMLKTSWAYFIVLWEVFQTRPNTRLGDIREVVLVAKIKASLNIILYVASSQKKKKKMQATCYVYKRYVLYSKLEQSGNMNIRRILIVRSKLARYPDTTAHTTMKVHFLYIITSVTKNKILNWRYKVYNSESEKEKRQNVKMSEIY